MIVRRFKISVFLLSHISCMLELSLVGAVVKCVEAVRPIVDNLRRFRIDVSTDRDELARHMRPPDRPASL